MTNRPDAKTTSKPRGRHVADKGTSDRVSAPTASPRRSIGPPPSSSSTDRPSHPDRRSSPPVDDNPPSHGAYSTRRYPASPARGDRNDSHPRLALHPVRRHRHHRRRSRRHSRTQWHTADLLGRRNRHRHRRSGRSLGREPQHPTSLNRAPHPEAERAVSYTH